MAVTPPTLPPVRERLDAYRRGVSVPVDPRHRAGKVFGLRAAAAATVGGCTTRARDRPLRFVARQIAGAPSLSHSGSARSPERRSPARIWAAPAAPPSLRRSPPRW